MQADWELLITNLAGATVGAIDYPGDLKYTRRENDFCELEFKTLDPNDMNHLEILPHKRKIKAYRNNVLVFWGRIAEPLIVNQDGAVVRARDPFARLSGPAHDTYTFVNKTFQEIVEIVLDGETTWRARDIAYSGATLSTQFNCKLKPGQRIDEFFRSLCSSNPNTGSWFRMDANDDPANPAAMMWFDAADRVDNTQARWEYGADTLDNVTGFEIQHRGLCNRVYVYSKDDVVTVEDTDSIAEFGLVEKWFRRPGINDIDTLTKIAYSKLVVSPYTVGSFEPGPNGPALFDDFDVGDKCRTYFKMGTTMYYSANDMIPSTVELTIDDSGVENMAFGEGLKANRRSRTTRHSGLRIPMHRG